MRIALDRGAGRAGKAPLSRQIQLHFERLISQGLLGSGVKLPATRELAQELGVNRTTVALAYDELVAGGWARAHVGQGTFVADRVPAPVGMPRAAAARLQPGAAARPGRHLLRGRHAGQRALPDRGLPARAQPGDPRGGPRAAAVLPGARVPASAGVPL